MFTLVEVVCALMVCNAIPLETFDTMDECQIERYEVYHERKREPSDGNVSIVWECEDEQE